MSSSDPQPDAPLAGSDAEPSTAPVPAAPSPADTGLKTLRVLSILLIVAGAVLLVAGTVTWFLVGDQLAAEKIVVSSDAEYFAGDPVDGPLTAYSEANTIRDHALEASGGKTYAELDQDDPTRDTVMTASFLRSSLFTSVVSFGVAAFAAVVGVLMIIIGYAILKIGKVVGGLQTARADSA